MSRSVIGSKSGVALAIGVFGILVLIGSDTYAAEPAGKRQISPATAAPTTSVRSMNGSHRLNRGNLAAPSRPAAYEGKTVVTYNIVNAWPKAPSLRPGAYQLVSAGKDGAPKSPTGNGGFVAEPRKPAATEAVTIAVEPIVRVSASAGPAAFESPSAQDGNTIYVATQWVPASTGDDLGDISQIQQIDINKAR